MPENGTTQPIDYYAALGLQPASPSHALFAQLSHRIAQTTIGPTRALMEQARAVLGDPVKRQAYDLRLRDPQASPWTASELHELAMAPSSRAPRRGAVAKLTALPRGLAAIAGGMLVLLIIVLVLVGCGGSASDTASNSNTSRSEASSDCRITAPVDLDRAGWLRKAQPDYAVVITEAYPLPGAMANQVRSAPYSVSDNGLTLYPGRQIGLAIFRTADDIFGGMPMLGDGSVRNTDATAHSALYTTDGRLLGERTFTGSFEEAVKTTVTPATLNGGKGKDSDELGLGALKTERTYGPYRVAAKEGITIPAAAAVNATDYRRTPWRTLQSASAANTTEGSYVLNAIADEDDTAVWLLLRGGTDLYKAKLVEATGDVDPAGCV